MAANVQGFLLCWYSVIVQPEPLLSKVNEDDIIFCCSTLFVKPELQMISERDDQYILSASIAENLMLCAAFLSNHVGRHDNPCRQRQAIRLAPFQCSSLRTSCDELG